MVQPKLESKKCDRDFWAYVEHTAREVAEWPHWMKGTLDRAGDPRPKGPKSKRRILGYGFSTFVSPADGKRYFNILGHSIAESEAARLLKYLQTELTK